ncbi:hypothetical protein [Methylophilus sp. TWE2]|uniref:hypothetical protein n=1 Tax=Methylophilus sp. TWE2 TaxID=1662285 RepID=UPI00067108D5|nr:hypothetical protein [Methylophilus sp. TWE2]AKR42892.1 hypothetical protein ACJ67_05275 [Methylophilus sp. TWE2]
MTSISSISSNNNIQSLSQVGQRNGMQPPPPPPDGEGHGKDGGGLLGAIDSALKSAGIEGGLESIFGKSGTSSTSSTTSADGTETIESSDSSRDAASALNSFLQNLMSALQSQGTDTSSENSTEASSTVEASATQGMPPPPPYGGHGMEGKLQSLISSLTHSSSESTSDTSSDSSSDLENSFQSLVSTLGGNSENTSLSGFLQALSSSMQHHGPVGNVVSTTA